MMKHYTLTLALLLAFTALLAQPEKQEIYTIHLGSFVEVDHNDFTEVKPLGYLYAETFSQHLTQVFLGEYSDKTVAESYLKNAKSAGFPDAYLSIRRLLPGEDVQVIQIGAEIATEKIHWEQYQKATPISVLLEGDQVRIVCGPFRSNDATNKKLEDLRQLGYANSFLRTVHSLRLHPVTDFEAPNLFLPVPERSLAIAQSAPVASVPKPDFSEALSEEVLAGESKATTPPPTVKIPDNHVPEFAARSGEDLKIAVPAIRMDIKRTSALRLQTALKLDEWYEGSLDGVYGKGTLESLSKFFDKDDEWKKVQVLKKFFPVSPVTAKNTLSIALNSVIEDPRLAESSLTKSAHPVAKAYLAYMYHTNRGDMETVNALMNSANKIAYSRGKAPYNVLADYSYKNLAQLIDHLAMMHAANRDVAVPCWLFQRHPDLAKSSFKKVEDYTMESCDPFLDWEMVAALKIVAIEMDPTPHKSQMVEAEMTSLRSKMFVNPEPLKALDKENILKWYDDLWNGFDAWLAKDPLHQKMSTPLKVSFFQSQVLIEDYYLDQGFTYESAKPMAIMVLKTLVGQHLKSYKI